jgi:iron complex outermembrane recepter protein
VEINRRGVPANGSYVQANGQLPIITGGNLALKPETSESTVVGFAYAPSWLKGKSWIDSLTVEADYYSIKVQDAIASVDASVLLANCTNSLDALSCAAITRSATGQITQIRGILQNIASIDSKGVDISVAYLSPKTKLGTFGAMWTANMLDEYTTALPSSTGKTIVKFKGTETGGQAYPEWKSNLTASWRYDNIFASLTARYIGKVTEPSNGDNLMEATTFTDIQAGWAPKRFGGKYEVTFGINNVFDKTPPLCLSCGGYDSSTYDIMGQFGYLRLTYKH